MEREEEGNEQLMNSPPKGQQLKQKTKKNADVVEKDSKVNEEEDTPKQQSPPDALKCLKPFVGVFDETCSQHFVHVHVYLTITSLV